MGDGHPFEGLGHDGHAQARPGERSGPAAVTEGDVLGDQIPRQDVPVVRTFQVSDALDLAGELPTRRREQPGLAGMAAELEAEPRPERQ